MHGMQPALRVSWSKATGAALLVLDRVSAMPTWFFLIFAWVSASETGIPMEGAFSRCGL